MIVNIHFQNIYYSDRKIWSSSKQITSAPSYCKKMVLNCSICEEEYSGDIRKQNPIMLPCGHTFCYNCLLKIQNTTKLCPNCRKQWYGTINDFGTNYVAIASSDPTTKSSKIYDKKCEIHKKVSFFYCEDCEELLCKLCINGDHTECTLRPRKKLNILYKEEFINDLIPKIKEAENITKEYNESIGVYENQLEMLLNYQGKIQKIIQAKKEFKRINDESIVNMKHLLEQYLQDMEPDLHEHHAKEFCDLTQVDSQAVVIIDENTSLMKILSAFQVSIK